MPHDDNLSQDLVLTSFAHLRAHFAGGLARGRQCPPGVTIAPICLEGSRHVARYKQECWAGSMTPGEYQGPVFEDLLAGNPAWEKGTKAFPFRSLAVRDEIDVESADFGL